MPTLVESLSFCNLSRILFDLREPTAGGRVAFLFLFLFARSRFLIVAAALAARLEGSVFNLLSPIFAITALFSLIRCSLAISYADRSDIVKWCVMCNVLVLESVCGEITKSHIFQQLFSIKILTNLSYWVYKYFWMKFFNFAQMPKKPFLLRSVQRTHIKYAKK